MILIVHRLHWEQLDPARRTFDPAPARRAAEPIVGALAAENPGRKWDVRGDPRLERCAQDLDVALLDAYGPWVAGWDWAASEPGGGGPIRSWCCENHSVLPEGEPAEATVERVVRALSEWRAFLEELAATQAELRAEAAALAPEAAVERAAARYATLVIARTDADDAWYRTFSTVLRWHLESCGYDSARAERAITEVVRGRFHSWSTPPQGVVAEVAAEIGLRTTEAFARPAAADDDALAAWLALRENPRPYDVAPDERPAARDGHRVYVDTYDAARSPERARRMHAALDGVRAAALGGGSLDWALLREAARTVLGDPGADFRRGDAFAHGGRERYALEPDTRARFEQCLAQANDERAGGVLHRAATVYLDVCFFHPFDDGNARAARLALDYVLTRAGLALRTAAPAFALPRSARDPGGAWVYAYLLRNLVGRRGAGLR